MHSKNRKKQKMTSTTPPHDSEATRGDGNETAPTKRTRNSRSSVPEPEPATKKPKTGEQAILSTGEQAIMSNILDFVSAVHDEEQDEEKSDFREFMITMNRICEVCDVNLGTAIRALRDSHCDELAAIDALLAKKDRDDEEAELRAAIAQSIAENPAPVADSAPVPAPSGDKCPVCFEIFWDKPGARKIMFPCTHATCVECANQLVLRELSCPICRQFIAGTVECIKKAPSATGGTDLL